LPVAFRLNPRLHVCDPLGRQRVCPQIRGSRRLIDPAGTLDPLKKTHQSLRIKACTVQRVKANAVSLALGIPRERKHPVLAKLLPERHEASGRLRVRARRERSQYQSNQLGDARVAAPCKHPGDMPLGHMADLMRQHTGKLRFAFSGCDQPRMNANEAPREGKGVETAVAHQKELEVLGAAARSHQAAAEILEVGRNIWILLGCWRIAQIAHDAFTEPPLNAWRKHIRGRIAELGKRCGGTRWDKCEVHSEDRAATRHAPSLAPHRPPVLCCAL